MKKELTVLIMVFLFAFSYPAGAEQPQFILIHLDAIAASDFYRELEAGNLPATEKIFSQEGAFLTGLAPFPGGTQMIVSRMKTGYSSRVGEPVGWGVYDQERDRITGKPTVFFQYVPEVLRRARGCLINIYPIMEFQAWFSLYNLPELLQTYNVLEFYWYTTDFLGHYFGEGPHNRSIHRFDFWLGQMADRLDWDRVNLVIYGDHGMSFSGLERINFPGLVQDVVGDKIHGQRYPNIFVREEASPAEVAWILGTQEEICLAFYREGEDLVVGFHQGGEIKIQENERGELKYSFTGSDYFGYYAAGYGGEYLDPGQWLNRTFSLDYPAAPVNIFNLVQNPASGEVITVVNPPRIPADPIATRFPIKNLGGVNHTGLYHTDLLVPVLLRGPELEHLYQEDAVWLHELYGSIPALDFSNPTPSRELHSFQLALDSEGERSKPGFSITLSPAYRWKTGFQYREEEWLASLSYDIFSSYLLRIWLGAGISFQDGNPGLHVLPEVDLRVGPFLLNWDVGLGDRPQQLALGIEFGQELHFWWQLPGEIGVGINW